MARRTGSIKDRGTHGLVFDDKRIVTKGAAWVESQRGVALLEDFIAVGGTLATSNVTINQAGTATAAAAISATAGGAAGQAGHGGWVAGSVDNVDAEIDEVALGAKPWQLVSRAGNGVIVGEAGFVVPTALTARQYGFYLTDSETEGTGTNGSLNIQTGTTVVDIATNAAGFIMSSLATDADGWYMANTNAGTQANVGNSGLTAVVDIYQKFRVEIDSAGNCYFFGGVGPTTTSGRNFDIAYLGVAALGVATTAILLPLFSAAATTTTAVEWEVDYLFGAAAG